MPRMSLGRVAVLTPRLAGPKLLSQLDLLACESLMSESSHLPQVVKENARILAGELLDALACFISPEDEKPPSVQDGLSGDDASGDSAAEIFTECLVRALQLKASLVLSRKRYKLVFFVPGDKFDGTVMMPDTDRYSNFLPRRKRNRMGLPKRCEVDGERAVRLCLFPALYCKGEEGHDGDEGIGVGIEDCLVNFANFDVGGADGIGPYKVVVKAVVSV